MKFKTLLIDIDGTICTEERTFDIPLAKPFKGAREKINAWYDNGHTIIFWSARGWEQYKITEKWLNDNGFKYHQILLGKPQCTIFIDDRARKFQGWDKDYLGEI